MLRLRLKERSLLQHPIETFFSSVKVQQVPPGMYAETYVCLHVTCPLLAFDLAATGMTTKR